MVDITYFSERSIQAALKRMPRLVQKVITDTSATLTTTASPVTLFAVTGDVIARVFATTQTAVTSTSNDGTLAIGVTGNTGALIAATTMDGTNFPTGSVWAGDTSPTVKAEVLSSASLNRCIIAGGADIIATIATHSSSAGALTFYCEWTPLSPDGDVQAA